MQIKELITYLEQIAPLSLQESYDNAGLIVGDPIIKLQGALICLDSTEAVVDEAIELGCNLIIAHHPIIFKGLKKLNGKNYIERTIIKAIRYDIAIYAIHTNLDNIFTKGVNARIAKKIGLSKTSILAPKQNAKKLSTIVPVDHADQLRQALFSAGAGDVFGTANQSYAGVGMQTQNGHGGAAVKIEFTFAAEKQGAIVKALHKHHPDEQIAYDIFSTENKETQSGAGIIGKLKKPIHERNFLEHLKKVMKAGVVKYTRLSGKKVRTVAVCGGSGGFLLPVAIAKGADVFVTADYKYHEYFDANGKIVIADIGHYESEQFTIDLLFDIISEKFSTFALHCTKVNTNPVKYL